MSSFQFSSCLSCLSCFNFFSNCIKSNKSQYEDQNLLLGNDKELSQHGSAESKTSPYNLDNQFTEELTPAPPNNSPEKFPNNESS